MLAKILFHVIYVCRKHSNATISVSLLIQSHRLPFYTTKLVLCITHRYLLFFLVNPSQHDYSSSKVGELAVAKIGNTVLLQSKKRER